MTSPRLLLSLLVPLASTPAWASPLALRAGEPNVSFSDATLFESAPEANAGASIVLEVGSTNAPAGRERALLRVDSKDVPLGVTSARLKVWLEKVQSHSRGGSRTREQLQLVRIPANDAAWNAGSGTGREPQTGAVSWNYRSYDPSRFEPGNARAGQARHLPWSSGPGLQNASEVVATAPLPPNGAPGWVTFTIADVRGLSDGGGFLLRSPGAEFNSHILRFTSSESPDLPHRPTLELDTNDQAPATTNALTYSLAGPARVSMHISNAQGEVVKELLFAAPRSAGHNSEAWDGKRDALNKADTDLALPDGVYTAKMLQGPGLSAEYLLTLGTTTPNYEPWPGNHLPAIGLAADESGVYVAGGVNEAPSVAIKMTADGKRLWSEPEYWYDDWQGGHSLASDGGKLFFLQQNGKLQVLQANAATKRGEQTTFDAAFCDEDRAWNKRERAGERLSRLDMAARAGRLLLSDEISNQIRWLDQNTGKIIAQAAVPNAYGVALDGQGRGYVISGNALWRFEPNGTTPTVLMGPDKLASPFRISINPRNGEIYVAETSTQVKARSGWDDGDEALARTPTSEQIKRFSPDGRLLQTYGKRGGRAELGRYDGASGFRGVTSLAVAPDGSFWVSEAYTPPRRVAHFSKSGQLLGEWFGGQQYANHAAPEGDGPGTVWMDCNENTLIRAQVDYRRKTWKPLGVYRFRFPLIGAHYHEGGRWVTRSHNGRLYLLRENSPAVLLWDEGSDRLRPLSVANCAHLPWESKDKGWLVPPSLRPTDGSAPPMFSWWDKDGDGAPSRDEITFFDTFIWDMEGGGSTNCAIGADFSYTGSLHPDADQGAKAGPGVLTPTWQRVNGVNVPVYNWSQLAHPFQSLPSPFDSWGDRGAVRDEQGNTFAFYNIHRNGGIFSSKLNFGEGAGAGVGGNRVVKWNKNGQRLWEVGRHAATSLPAPGEMLSFQRGLGSVKGCAIGSDIRNYAYVYNGDGLYIGRLLERAWGDTAQLPPRTLHLVEEQFGGLVVEIRDNATPGLRRGDVLFFAASDNSTPVFRIHGFDELQELRCQLTLRGGKIVAQTPFLAVGPNSSP